MDWAFCSVNGLGLNLWNFWRERKKKLLDKSAAKSSEKISEIWENWEKKMRVNGLGFFAPIFSRWTGLKFVEIWKKKLKNWKIEKIIVRMPFRKKKKGKSRETSVKFENLEEKMSKWTGLNKQTKNLSKFEEKRKNSRSVFGKKSREKQWKLERN